VGQRLTSQLAKALANIGNVKRANVLPAVSANELIIIYVILFAVSILSSLFILSIGINHSIMTPTIINPKVSRLIEKAFSNSSRLAIEFILKM
jgi:hypothetical protein